MCVCVCVCVCVSVCVCVLFFISHFGSLIRFRLCAWHVANFSITKSISVSLIKNNQTKYAIFANLFLCLYL